MGSNHQEPTGNHRRTRHAQQIPKRSTPPMRDTPGPTQEPGHERRRHDTCGKRACKQYRIGQGCFSLFDSRAKREPEAPARLVISAGRRFGVLGGS